MALASRKLVDILALNPGSSSLKFGLFSFDSRKLEPKVLVRSKIEISSSITFEAALKMALQDSAVRAAIKHVDACACRVVHAGSIFNQPTLMTPMTIERLETLNELAPLHNPISIETIRSFKAACPDLPIFAIFDSAFHTTLPQHAYIYALPHDVCSKFPIRRYGFHGISHRYIANQMQQSLGSAGSDLRLVSCHLGNGSSVCAIRAGVSIDTSMGFTPLEGLIMGTRCGDVDPGVILHLLKHSGKSVQQIDSILNSQSGYSALAGDSDFRAIEQRAHCGDQSANFAIDLSSYRLAKYIAAYSVPLQGLDAIAFSGGIGENSQLMRRMVCNKLSYMGVKIQDLSDQSVGMRRISSDSSSISVWVVPTDEELQIAIETLPFLPNSALI